MAKSDLDEAVVEYLEQIDGQSTSSRELEASLQALRDLSSYAEVKSAPLDPYASTTKDK